MDRERFYRGKRPYEAIDDNRARGRDQVLRQASIGNKKNIIDSKLSASETKHERERDHANHDARRSEEPNKFLLSLLHLDRGGATMVGEGRRGTLVRPGTRKGRVLPLLPWERLQVVLATLMLWMLRT
jgi:hypothetical protein